MSEKLSHHLDMILLPFYVLFTTVTISLIYNNSEVNFNC